MEGSCPNTRSILHALVVEARTYDIYDRRLQEHPVPYRTRAQTCIFLQALLCVDQTMRCQLTKQAEANPSYGQRRDGRRCSAARSLPNSRERPPSTGNTVSCRRQHKVILERGLDVFGGQVKTVEPAPFVKPDGNDPTHSKQRDDAVPESAKVPIEFGNESPEDSSELETSR
jgi:hypothetical protein